MNRTSLKTIKKTVAYYRVSTGRQGESGLGLEAQQATIKQFCTFRKLRLVKEFVEVKSGKKNKRPVLTEALDYCKKNEAVLIIAKLNRLGRNVAFISSLMESQVEFISADIPDASRFLLHVMAAVAQYQGEEISLNTKLALQAAKKRGVRLGTYGKVLAKRNRGASKAFARKLAPVISQLKMEGFKTIQSLTDELNKRKIKTYRFGCRWHKSTVYNVIKKSKQP